MADVIEINGLEQLLQYRMVWNALLPATPGAVARAPVPALQQAQARLRAAQRPASAAPTARPPTARRPTAR